jgi:hypothetical protein
VSQDNSALSDVTYLDNITPEDEALNTPISLTVSVQEKVNVFTSCSVSFVTVVVTLDTVALALSPQLPVISADKAVCQAAAAVLFEPKAI